MIVKKYRANIIAIENEIEGVYTLVFTGDKKFKYAPGQFLHIAIDNDYDGSGQWPESRCFSVQSSPDEENLKITYAVKGDFTSEMEKRLKLGSEVWLKMPYGELFDLEHNKKNTVFISGGTGITPFLSLFNDSSFKNYENPVLYAGFRTEEFYLYDEELKRALEINPNLKINNIFQDSKGILDIKKIFEENGKDASYFISGPPVMINNFKEALLEYGVAPADILTDDWE